jgi:pyridoxamine 5'-phosphate oxidase
MSDKNDLKQSIVKKTVRTLRRALNYGGLYEKDISSDPFEQFAKWMKDAVEKETFEPNAMTLATASKEGVPTARTVLLKDYDSQGFTFFTNYNSRKGQNLNSNPKASLVFYWGSLSRQVLIDGDISLVSRESSVEYFHSRPRGSQIAAYASNQSHLIQNRDELKATIKDIERKFKGKEVECPDNWGGYLLNPSRIEFWQGRPDRTHDRLCFTKTDENIWKMDRLAP